MSSDHSTRRDRADARARQNRGAAAAKILRGVARAREERRARADEGLPYKSDLADTSVEENSLAKAISDIRKALADDRKDPRYIVTLPRRGYRFVAPVKTLDSDRATIAHTVAVLPSRICADGEHDYVGIGLADAVIARLTRLTQGRQADDGGSEYAGAVKDASPRAGSWTPNGRRRNRPAIRGSHPRDRPTDRDAHRIDAVGRSLRRTIDRSLRRRGLDCRARDAQLALRLTTEEAQAGAATPTAPRRTRPI